MHLKAIGGYYRAMQQTGYLDSLKGTHLYYVVLIIFMIVIDFFTQYFTRDGHARPKKMFGAGFGGFALREKIQYEECMIERSDPKQGWARTSFQIAFFLAISRIIQVGRTFHL
jgi:hypothetical protein